MKTYQYIFNKAIWVGTLLIGIISCWYMKYSIPKGFFGLGFMFVFLTFMWICKKVILRITGDEDN